MAVTVNNTESSVGSFRVFGLTHQFSEV